MKNHIIFTFSFLIVLCIYGCTDDKQVSVQGPNFDLTTKELQKALGLSHVNVFFPPFAKRTKVGLGLKTSNGIEIQGHGVTKISGQGKVVWEKQDNLITYSMMSDSKVVGGSLTVPERFKLVSCVKSEEKKVYGNGSVIARWGISASESGVTTFGDGDTMLENEIGLVVIIEEEQ